MITASKETLRRPWTEVDKRRLITYWDTVGSVVLISILLDRPEGSVQTEASRLNLPRRTEDKGRHRKKWSQDESDGLTRATLATRDANGRIKIVQVAKAVGRSIDAVISKLEDSYESRDALKMDLAVSADEIEALSFVAVAPKNSLGTPGWVDTRNVSKPRTCMSCQKPFWSTGAGNRICPKCKSGDASDWN